MAQEFSLMIPDAAELPAHIINHELARQANEDAAFGISAGFPARIKMSGKQFVLVDGNGGETPIPMGKLFKGPDDNLYLRTIILTAKRELRKRWFATAYNKDDQGKMPDCFSNDGQRPDASIPNPQCDTCAACPMNAFGSGSNDQGAATNGKACSDEKVAAAYIPPMSKGEAAPGVHELKITPASLKNWGNYVKALSSRGISVGNVFTLIGFVNEATFPVMTFQYGGFLPEQAIAKMSEIAMQPEAQEIVTQKMVFSAKAEPAKKAADTSAAEAKKAEAAAKKKAEAAAKKKAEEDAAKAASAADDMGLGLDDEPSQVATVGAALDLSDDDILAELDL